MAGTFKSASAGEQNTFTASMEVAPGTLVSVSVSGTFAGTVTLQRSFDGSTWHDIAAHTVTAVSETTYTVDEEQDIRLGIKTGDYTSGAAVCRIGHGR